MKSISPNSISRSVHHMNSIQIKIELALERLKNHESIEEIKILKTKIEELFVAWDFHKKTINKLNGFAGE